MVYLATTLANDDLFVIPLRQVSNLISRKLSDSDLWQSSPIPNRVNGSGVVRNNYSDSSDKFTLWFS